MKLTELSITGAFVAESTVWCDDRGYFREWFKRGDFAEVGVEFDIHQANLSVSKRNVVRGLHYSIAPEGQAKLVNCTFGEVDDVIVDVRVGSPTFRRVEIVRLAANEERAVYLPAGTAHGFCVTSELAALTYLLSSPFNPAKELEINPFDESLNIPWAVTDQAIVSEKDREAPSLTKRLAASELPIFPHQAL